MEKFRGCLFAAVLVLGAPAWAQDDDRVVPAHEEPRHVPKLVNEWVRIIDVEIPEGGRTLYHAHALDYPYVMASSVMLDNQVYGQEPREVKIERGTVGYYRASTQGTYTHRFINRGPGTFRAIGIELLKPLQPGARISDPIPDSSAVKTVLDTERVRAYRIRLEPGESLGPVTISGPSIRVAVTEGRISEAMEGRPEAVSELAPAQFVFRAESATLTLRNTGRSVVELVEFELK
ncbi:MAG TPA: hypothetical protein VNM24_04540 [Burkholderiales bacterium]|jgi:hypothetical protein|nr:hypothetical protein [Burkholderiales bacterium]